MGRRTMSYIRISKVDGSSKDVSDLDKMVEELSGFWNLSREEMFEVLENGEKLWTPFATYQKRVGD